MSSLSELARRLHPRGRFGKGVALLAGGTAAGQAVVLVVSPLLTRLYTPEDFGVLGVFTSAIGILSIAACLRLEFAIPLPDDDADAAAVAILALTSTLMVAVVVAVVAALFGDRIAKLVNAPSLDAYGWLFVAGVLAIGLYQVLSYWAVRRRDYRHIARTRFTQGLSSAFVQVAGSTLGGPLGLLLGQVTVHAAGGASLGLASWRSDRSVLRAATAARLRTVALRYRAFPLVQMPASLLGATGLRLPPLLIASFFSVHIAGLFALGSRVVGAPVTLIGSSVSQVYVGEISRLVKTEPDAALRLFMTTARRLLATALIPVLAVVLAGPALFALLFGEEWRSAGTMMRLLAAMHLAQVVVYPLSHTLVVLERQRLQFAWDAGRLVLTVASLAGPRILGADPFTTIAVYGLAMSAAYVVHFLMMWWGLRVNMRVARPTGGVVSQ